MLLKRKYPGLFILALFSCLTLHAQDSTLVGTTLKWDLIKCIEYAKKNNIQINTLRLSKAISDQQYLLAKAGRLPDLSISATQNFAHGNNFNTGIGSGGSGLNASGNYGVNSSVTLYNGSYINNNILQKNLSVQSANLSIIQQENDITLQITQAYLTILLDKENIIYYTDLVTTSKAQVNLQQQRYNAGSIARRDFVQLQAQQAADQYSLVSAQNTLRNDVLTLKQLLLLPSDVNFDVVKPDTIVAADKAASSLRDAQQTALTTRPEVQNSELGVKIAEYGVDLAGAGYKPSLVAGASLGSGYVTGSNQYLGQLNDNFKQQLGLTLAIPIFTKRVVKTQVEVAKIAVEQSKLDLQNTKVVLSQNVERAYINVQNAQGQYDAASEGYKFSQESYRIANEQLRVGVANTVDLLLQKNLYVQAQQAFIQAKYNVILSLKIYDFYRGIPINL